MEKRYEGENSVGKRSVYCIS